MSNKRYSNKGVNSTAKAQANEAAAQESKRQTLIICAVAVAVVILAVVLAIVLGGSDSKLSGNKNETTTPNTSTTQSQNSGSSTEPNKLMDEVKAEIDSMEVVDFTETAKVTEYVKITVKHYGDIVIRLRGDIAPLTVKNFQDLVGKGFYTDNTFHRVIKGFMIQGGAPKKGTTAPATVKGEFSYNGVKNALSHITGVISMARVGGLNDSASSQFFICNDDAAAKSLDGQYASFGYVVAGLDVVMTVSEVEVKASEGSANNEVSTPVETLTIEKICFVEKK